ncbi:MAG TPA: PDZ domain-containing protein [Bryobacteraceae bacterium]|jgi:serine protease Do|nr:PDZ domain-containing protein [Bryobacteraceae bacterium]
MFTRRCRWSAPLLAVLAGLLFSPAFEAQIPLAVQYRPASSYLGVGLTDIDSDRANVLKLGEPRGVEVRSVLNNSPAENAGIQAGDVLLTYNGEEILSSPQLGRLVNETPPGRKVKIDYWRAGKKKSVIVTLQAPALQTNDATAQMGGVEPWGVSDIPRMLMLWDNMALGIECEPIDSQLAQYFGVSNGILVRQVGKGLIGERAGLKAGDVITSIDTRSIATPRDLISYLRTERQPGKRISIVVVRDHKPRSFSINLGE